MNPLIMKEQSKAENLSDDVFSLVDYTGFSSKYLSHVLYNRLQGITKSISRFPTFRRNFDRLVKSLTEELGKKDYSSRAGNGGEKIERSKSAFVRIFSNKSFKRKPSNIGSEQEEFDSITRDVEVS